MLVHPASPWLRSSEDAIHALLESKRAALLLPTHSLLTVPKPREREEEIVNLTLSLSITPEIRFAGNGTVVITMATDCLYSSLEGGKERVTEDGRSLCLKALSKALPKVSEKRTRREAHNSSWSLGTQPAGFLLFLCGTRLARWLHFSPHVALLPHACEHERLLPGVVDITSLHLTILAGGRFTPQQEKEVRAVAAINCVQCSALHILGHITS